MQVGVFNPGLQRRDLPEITPQMFGAKANGDFDDSLAVQQAVDKAISIGVNRIFFDFSKRQKYRLDATVYIEASGFELLGNASPTYSPQNGGYIFGPAGNLTLFNYGNNRTNIPSNQFTCDGIAFFSSAGKTQTAVKSSQNNNGPHRGTLFRKTCARGFLNVALFNVATPANLAAASVVVESCVFTGNTYSVNSVERTFGLRYSGNQSEQGARITGMFDSGVSIVDNMLEGQLEPINIDSNSPSVVIENNYFEAVTGGYLARVKGTNAAASIDLRANYISRPKSVDIYRIEGMMRVFERARLSADPNRISNITLLNAFTPWGTQLFGPCYIGTTGHSVDGARGFADPITASRSVPITASIKNDLGAVALTSPVGKTTAGVSINGFPATYFSIAKTWGAGDVLVCCALVRLESNAAERPYMGIYNDAYTATGLSCGGATAQVAQDGEWYLMYSVGAAAVGGTSCRFRFGSNQTSAGATNIHIASVGVDVIPAAKFVTFESAVRAPVRLFTPPIG